MTFDYNSPTKITDTKGRNGLLLERDIYRKAWFHENFQRWDVTKYGEQGTSVNFQDYENTQIEFFLLNFPKYKNRMLLDRKDIDSFYYENPQSKIYAFGKYTILFPLKICKQVKINEE